MKRKNSSHSFYTWLIIGLLALAIIVPTISTAVWMGYFSSEPVLETAPVTDDPNAPVLRIATDSDFCPNSYYNDNGDLSGLYIEIITEVANRLGMRPEFQTGAWLDCRAMLEDGDVDVLLGLEIFSNMEGTLRTIPICSDELCVYGKTSLDSAAGLAGKRVALMARSVIEATYDLQCEYVEYYTNTDILQAVENGDVDYAICHAAVSSKIIEQHGFHLKKGVTIAKSYPALAVDDAHPELKEQVNAVLEEMSLDGTLGRLNKKWITDFTKDRSFSAVVRQNKLFYITFFLCIAVALCLCVTTKLLDHKQTEYIFSLLTYQKKLKDSNEKALRANRAKSEFLSHMSHDIRTPMNGIMGMVERIRRNEHDPQIIEDCLRKIDGASNHLLSLLNDVLDMSELEHGKIKLEQKPFDLTQELNLLHQIVEEQPNEKQISFEIQADDLAHTALLGSPLHLRRILLNLVSNALKYNKQNGSVTLTVQEHSISDTRSEYIFLVKDTGIGMSPDFVEHHLFQPFTQENDNVRTVYQGTGLGMSIVHALVTAMQGSISVESTLDVGTTFTVRLPFDLCSEPIAPTEEAPEKPVDISGLHILIVEDNALNLELAQYMLADAGVTTSVAENGKQAIDVFSQSAPGTFDAILMDIMMPVMDGITAAQEIRKLPREDANIPIIAMTANAFEEDKEKTRAAGMTAYLVKPVDAVHLHKILAAYCFE